MKAIYPVFVVKLQIRYGILDPEALKEAIQFIEKVKDNVCALPQGKIIPYVNNDPNFLDSVSSKDIAFSVSLSEPDIFQEYSYNYEYDCIDNLSSLGLLFNTADILDLKNVTIGQGLSLSLRPKFYFHFMEYIDFEYREVEFFLLQNKLKENDIYFIKNKSVSFERLSSIEKIDRNCGLAEIDPERFYQFNFFRIKFNFSGDIAEVSSLSEVLIKDMYFGDSFFGKKGMCYSKGKLVLFEKFLNKNSEYRFFEDIGVHPVNIFNRFWNILLNEY